RSAKRTGWVRRLPRRCRAGAAGWEVFTPGRAGDGLADVGSPDLPAFAVRASNDGVQIGVSVRFHSGVIPCDGPPRPDREQAKQPDLGQVCSVLEVAAGG